MSSESSVTLPGKPSAELSTGASAEASRPSIALPAGTVLRDEYRLGEVLGTGSFGITYRATDEHLRETVAIKEYYPRRLAGRTGGSPEVEPHSSEDTEDFERGLQRFMVEGRTVARFDHPNVVGVRSFFEENGTGYLVMDYYDGASLKQYLSKKGGAIPEEEAVSIILDVLSGLEAVHEEEVLHRDVGPKNIYRKSGGDSLGGEAILIDFGAAREAVGRKSRELSTILTPGYAPIEQYMAERQGPQTDIYACAATLHKCLTGEKPPEATRRAEGEAELPPHSEICPGASRETRLAVRKGLALRPGRRPGSAEAFKALLQGESHEEAEGERTVEPTQRGTQIGAEPAPDQAEFPESGEDVEGILSEEVLEETPAEEPATSRKKSDAFFWQGALRPVALGVAIVASIGGALLFGDAGPLQVFAYVGTWIASAGGIVLLFREGEKAMSPEAKAAVSDWLLKEDFAERTSNWPETFASLFDAVFTEDHLSWTCFWRSSVASVITVTTLFVSFAFVADWSTARWRAFYAGGNTGLEFDYLWAPWLVTLAFSCSINVVADYFSLYETRQVLKWMSRSKRTTVHAGYLMLDAIISYSIIGIIFIILFFVSSLLIPYFKESILHVSDMTSTYSLITYFISEYASLSRLRISTKPDLLPLIVFSTMFTSVWV